MGYYTELIFGAVLKKETPDLVIRSLQYMLGISDRPDNFPLPDGRCERLFQLSGCYFAVSRPINNLFLDFGDNWVLTCRCNLKNYEGEIESFLNWIEPYVAYGSGKNDIFAIVIKEDDELPEIYKLKH